MKQKLKSWKLGRQIHLKNFSNRRSFFATTRSSSSSIKQRQHKNQNRLNTPRRNFMNNINSSSSTLTRFRNNNTPTNNQLRCFSSSWGSKDVVFSEIVNSSQEDPQILSRIYERMHPEAREKFMLSATKELNKLPVGDPAFRQYLQLALINGVPMFGFGFVDNVGLLMIGDVLDSTICMRLGLSTFFAAACANTISDVGGLAIGGFLEKLGIYMGLRHHEMSLSQLKRGKAWCFKYSGMAIGMTLGCILGMFPLIMPEKYFPWRGKRKKHESTQTENLCPNCLKDSSTNTAENSLITNLPTSSNLNSNIASVDTTAMGTMVPATT